MALEAPEDITEDLVVLDLAAIIDPRWVACTTIGLPWAVECGADRRTTAVAADACFP